jgi:hypothetical protein
MGFLSDAFNRIAVCRRTSRPASRGHTCLEGSRRPLYAVAAAIQLQRATAERCPTTGPTWVEWGVSVVLSRFPIRSSQALMPRDRTHCDDLARAATCGRTSRDTAGTMPLAAPAFTRHKHSGRRDGERPAKRGPERWGRREGRRRQLGSASSASRRARRSSHAHVCLSPTRRSIAARLERAANCVGTVDSPGSGCFADRFGGEYLCSCSRCRHDRDLGRKKW